MVNGHDGNGNSEGMGPRGGTKYPGIFDALGTEFGRDEIKSRMQGGQKLWYITARMAMNRLDEVLGPEHWWDEYRETSKGMECRLTIRLPDGSTVTKTDGGGYAGMKAADDDTKSAYSDSFKRAAAKFGVARYLYRDGTPEFGTVQDFDPDTGEARDVVPEAMGRSELPDGGSPRTDRAYREWQAGLLGRLNERWRDYWTTRLDGDTRGVPDTFLDGHRLSGHMVKHYGGPATQNSNHRVRFLGIRLRDDAEAFAAEAESYARRVFVELRDRVQRDLSMPAEDEPGDPDRPDYDPDPTDPEDAEIDRLAAREG